MNDKKTVVNRTTLALYKSMFQLLDENCFDDITVNDICQQAMVSRSTFYAHFSDKYDLIIFSLLREREKLGIIQGESPQKNLFSLLLSIKENKIIYRNLLIAQLNQELLQMIVVHTSSHIEYYLEDILVSSEELVVLTKFYSSGLAGLVMWWLEHDIPVSEDDLSKYIHHAILSAPSINGI